MTDEIPNKASRILSDEVFLETLTELIELNQSVIETQIAIVEAIVPNVPIEKEQTLKITGSIRESSALVRALVSRVKKHLGDGSDG